MEYLFKTEEIDDIEADLDIVGKYHKGTKELVHKEKSNLVNTTASIRLLYQVDNDKASIFEDFDIGKIVDQLKFERSHVQNLFILLRNMNDIDWQYYQTHFSSNDAVNGVNLNAELKSLITDFKVLKKQLASDGILETKIKLREFRTIGANQIPYDVTGMGVTVKNLEENKQIIKIILDNRVKQIEEISNLYSHITEISPIEWSVELTEEILKYLKEPFPDYRARWLFGRLATQKILTYLKSETNFFQNDIEVTQQQGILIYTLFLLFGFIDIKFEDDAPVSKLDRDKAKLIRSFLRQDLKDKEVEFYNLMFTQHSN